MCLMLFEGNKTLNHMYNGFQSKNTLRKRKIKETKREENPKQYEQKLIKQNGSIGCQWILSLTYNFSFRWFLFIRSHNFFRSLSLSLNITQFRKCQPVDMKIGTEAKENKNRTIEIKGKTRTIAVWPSKICNSFWHWDVCRFKWMFVARFFGYCLFD